MTNIGSEILGFSPSMFFFGFLPPIIYNSGYHLKRISFYNSIVPILSLAIVGTLISIGAVATCMHLLLGHEHQWVNAILGSPLTIMECVAYGALISSTDPICILNTFTAYKVN